MLTVNAHINGHDTAPVVYMSAGRASQPPFYGTIVMWFSTLETPGAAHAARPTSCLSKHDRTLPRSFRRAGPVRSKINQHLLRRRGLIEAFR